MVSIKVTCMLAKATQRQVECCWSADLPRNVLRAVYTLEVMGSGYRETHVALVVHVFHSDDLELCIHLL